MKKLSIMVWLLIATLTVLGQDDPKTAAGKLGPNPVFILDSQKVSQSDLSRYHPDSIATVIMLYDTAATKRYGNVAKDGLVIIETRSFARKLFTAFFRRASPAYDSLYNVAGNDQSFVYILNENIQKDNYEGNLSSINDELFIKLDILTKEQLKAKYNIDYKQFGILVYSKKPKDLYNGDKKF